MRESCHNYRCVKVFQEQHSEQTTSSSSIKYAKKNEKKDVSHIDEEEHRREEETLSSIDNEQHRRRKIRLKVYECSNYWLLLGDDDDGLLFLCHCALISSASYSLSLIPSRILLPHFRSHFYSLAVPEAVFKWSM